ncbi:dihydrofolate reductase family protein [bacterium]|nr:dihydrofolate reductase family protein [bacterium]
MRILSLYLATSLDGKIVGRDDDHGWLFHDQDYGFSEFIADVDTLVMGRKTYEQALAFSADWPFTDKRSIVFTRNNELQPIEQVEVTRDDPVTVVRGLKGETGGKIWLFGGAEFAKPLLDAGLIDELVLAIHPVVLGSGRPLFSEHPERWFELAGVESFPTGLVSLTYRYNPARRRPPQK